MTVPTVVRVAEVGKPAFGLRKGEEGISVFDPDAVQPPLSEQEILASFRTGSQVLVRTAADIVARGLQIVPVEGAQNLPERLRQAHREIRPGIAMSRAAFKQQLRELE
jgi:hypothetical protein